ncbi:hypothetical protein NHP200010_10610 [Helicobacter bizzozeronii]|nr:hypothetical protein NHP200010_10610 [Helicobacter bizzozeronii]
MLQARKEILNLWDTLKSQTMSVEEDDIVTQGLRSFGKTSGCICPKEFDALFNMDLLIVL